MSGGPFRRRSGGPRLSSPGSPTGDPRAILRQPGNWLLALVIIAVLAYITYNTLTTEGPGSRGLPWGTQLPPFAVPLVTADLPADTDAALDPKKVCDRDLRAVHRPDVVNSCVLTRRGPLAVAFFANPAGVCKQQIDTFDRAVRRHPRVAAIAVAIRGDRDDVRRTVRQRGWRIPVAYDHDGALTNAVAAAICPTIAFVRRGGAVAHTSLGELDGRQLDRLLTRIQQPAPAPSR